MKWATVVNIVLHSLRYPRSRSRCDSNYSKIRRSMNLCILILEQECPLATEITSTNWRPRRQQQSWYNIDWQKKKCASIYYFGHNYSPSPFGAFKLQLHQHHHWYSIDTYEWECKYQARVVCISVYTKIYSPIQFLFFLREFCATFVWISMVDLSINYLLVLLATFPSSTLL